MWGQSCEGEEKLQRREEVEGGRMRRVKSRREKKRGEDEVDG